MFRCLTIAFVGCLIGAVAAHADEPPRAPNWSLGGAALTLSDSSRVTLWNSEEGLMAGFGTSANPNLSGFSSSGLQTGGFLAWQSSIYRIDATVAPSFDGQISAGFGASIGAPPGEEGTRYGLRIGTALAANDRYPTYPGSGASLADWTAPYRNVNFSLMVNHSLSPNLSLIGMAEAQRPLGYLPLDGNSGLGRLMVGAGLGYKF